MSLIPGTLLYIQSVVETSFHECTVKRECQAPYRVVKGEAEANEEAGSKRAKVNNWRTKRETGIRSWWIVKYSRFDTSEQEVRARDDACQRSLPVNEAPNQCVFSQRELKDGATHNIMAHQSRSERHANRESHLDSPFERFPSRRVVAAPGRVRVGLNAGNSAARDDDGSVHWTGGEQSLVGCLVER